MIEFIVTGTGRSTTKYTAEVLTAAELPCGHEHACSSWMDDYSDDQVWRDAPSGVGESSWQAAPFTDAMQAEGVKVIHLVRHPAEVASSLIGNRMLLPEPEGGALLPWHEFIKAHLGDRLWRLHPHDRALQFWVDWNLLIKTPDLRWTAPVTGREIDDLAYLLGRRADTSAIDSVSKQVNHWREVEHLKRRDFTQVVWDEAMDLWRSYF